MACLLSTRNQRNDVVSYFLIFNRAAKGSDGFVSEAGEGGEEKGLLETEEVYKMN